MIMERMRMDEILDWSLRNTRVEFFFSELRFLRVR